MGKDVLWGADGDGRGSKSLPFCTVLRRDLFGICWISSYFVSENSGFYTPRGYEKVFFYLFSGGSAPGPISRVRRLGMATDRRAILTQAHTTILRQSKK
jgi:hypothetical protein